MKNILLTQSKSSFIDNDDYELLNSYKWSFNGLYAVRKFNGKTWYMHWDVIGKPQKGFEVDHINGNKLDNRRSNLRICRRNENSRNKTKQKNNTSGYKGVSWNRRDKKWVAYISINGKHIFLGSFNLAVDACNAYEKVAKELHGDFFKKD